MRVWEEATPCEITVIVKYISIKNARKLADIRKLTLYVCIYYICLCIYHVISTGGPQNENIVDNLKMDLGVLVARGKR